jgi:hypothetical protein
MRASFCIIPVKMMQKVSDRYSVLYWYYPSIPLKNVLTDWANISGACNGAK